MPQLEIRLLGTMQVVRDDGNPLHLPPIVQSLFAYMVLYQYRDQQRQGYRREALANLFWSEQPEKNARRCLSTALWRLRRELDSQSDSEYLLSSVNGEIGFNFGSAHWLDIAAFEQGVRFGLATPMEEMTAAQVEALERAAKLYTGDLLEDCYQEWALRERERLNLLYLRCLGRLMGYFRHHGAYEQGVQYGKKILAVDPLREQVHRELMMIYVESGQRALALQQYELCRRTLAEELGIEPMTETQQLYEGVRDDGGLGFTRPFAAVADGQKLELLLAQLKAAMRDLDAAREQLSEVKQAVAQLLSQDAPVSL